MNEEDTKKVINALANATFQSLNPNGMINAAKFYSVRLAEQKFNEIDDEQKQKILAEIDEAEKQSQDSQLQSK